MKLLLSPQVPNTYPHIPPTCNPPLSSRPLLSRPLPTFLDAAYPSLNVSQTPRTHRFLCFISPHVLPLLYAFPLPALPKSSLPRPTSGAPFTLRTDAIRNVREQILELRQKLTHLPGLAAHSVAPPPLILCDAEAHLARPSLAILLGGRAGGRLLAGRRGGVEEEMSDSPRAALAEV